MVFFPHSILTWSKWSAHWILTVDFGLPTVSGTTVRERSWALLLAGDTTYARGGVSILDFCSGNFKSGFPTVGILASYCRLGIITPLVNMYLRCNR